MKVLSVLDSGGFGRVELVEMPNGFRVARKVLSPDSTILNATTLEKLQGRFKREVSVQRELSSDYVVPILQSNLEPPDLWYTMPICDRNYEEQIYQDKKEGNDPTSALLNILGALEYIHGLQIKHRDLKPKNILRHEGVWKLSDFGLVTPPAESSTNLTTTLSSWGTASYMAPEQINDFKHAEITVDIYAFGCILHDIFSDDARIPYARHTTDGPIGLVIERCCDLEPARRFQSVSRLRSALLDALSKSKQPKTSLETADWMAKLVSPEGWEELQLKEFARFVEGKVAQADLYAVMMVVDETRIEEFYGLNSGYAETVSLCLAEWVERTSFEFEFCNVVTRRLVKVVDLGGVDSKSRAILAVARLGKKHNRFYTMRKLIELCGEGMDIALATRVAFDIRVENHKWDFVDSANRVDQGITVFHEVIQAALS